MWQKRYGAVSPERTDTNRRLYSEADIERLRLLRAVVDSGHRIGDVARLPDDDLRRLAPEAARPEVEDEPSHAAAPFRAEDAIEAGVASTLALDAAGFQQVLARASATLGFRAALERFFAPLMYRIGDLWREGSLTAAHEHFASAAVRTFLLGSPRTFVSGANPPVLVVVTPVGQLHEVGAVLAASTAGDLGWKVVFLGSSLPAAEIAGAAIQHRARAVALSIVYPPDDPQIPNELRLLRQALPSDVRIIVGGRAAPEYAAALTEIEAVLVRNLRELEGALDDARRRPPR